MPIEQDMELQRQRHIEQLTQLEEKSAQSALFLEHNTETREFDYYQKVSHPLVDSMEDGHDVVITQEADHAEVREETRHERKKREQREQKMAQAREKALDAKRAEADMAGQRRERIDAEGATTEQFDSREESLLSLKLEAIKLNKTAAIESLKGENRLTDAMQREIEWKAQADIAAAAGDYARSLPPGTAKRARAMARKEKEELKADRLRRWYKVTQIEVPAEREREEATIKRHAKYDVMKSITSFFSSDNPLTHEDAVWEQDGKKLVNVGRAFFGGTKPMYIFEDRNDPIERDGQISYKKYLFKTAVNCLGFKKPEGALVTEAAAQLQSIICGDLSIPAFAAKRGEEVLGSFQEKIERTREPEQPVDLFKWQADPSTDLPAETKDELLREHMLDWLLCNFDTKGENFLQTEDGNIMSFDKEASFSFITKDGSQHMDTEYIPHSNTTIYNVLFTQFANGSLDLDLQKTEEYLASIEDMDREQYLGMFDAMLTQKYGESGERNTERLRIEDLIWSRKDNLREEYRRFYGDLLEKRHRALEENGDLPDHTEEVTEDGRFKFSHDEERVDALCTREQLRTGVVPNVTLQQLQTHGGASFHQLRSKEEAERLVRDSGGFLYMKDAGNGTYELRPTMPETAVIGGSEIRLRRNYNRFIKLIVRKGIDEHGQLRPDATKSVADIIYLLNSKVTSKSKASAEHDIENEIGAILGKFAQDKSIFGDDPRQGVEEFVDFLKKMIRMSDHPESMDCLGSTLINGEAEGAWSGWVDSVRATREPLEQRVEKIRRKMQEDGAGEDEISAKIRAVTMMYKDAEDALSEMIELRDMDVDSPDIALVNACSSNADTLAQIAAKTRDEAPQVVLFETWTHIAQNPHEIIEWLHDRQERSGGEFLNEDDQSTLAGIVGDLGDADTCSMQQAIDLYNLSGYGAKYEYHKAPIIGTSGDRIITCETFAPETCQLTVSPFTRHIAVGVYNHGASDMQEYYKIDNPLANEEMMERVKVKDELRGGTLPGDSDT